MDFKPLSEKEESIAKKIVDAVYIVHKKLGPGLLEKVYDDLTFDEGLRLDVLVEDLVICELKAVDEINPVWEAQILSHLKLTGKRLGFLINFNVPLIKNGIKRIIL
ncbi:MAG: GxxExxY protein [Bacteroidota bacterium]|nr:GxxExxY protein [Bacteroidota bacterium]